MTAPDAADDAIILSHNLDGHSPRLSVDATVQVGHLAGAAARTGRSPTEVIERLHAHGFTHLHDPADLPAAVCHDDSRLLSRNHDGLPPWLSPDESVPPGHLLGAAARAGLGLAHVIGRLRAYGFTRLPERAAMPAAVAPDDVVLLSRDLDGRPSWLLLGEAVPGWHIAHGMVATGRDSGYVVQRLRAYGFGDIQDPVGLPAAVEPGDAVMVSRDADGRAPWLMLDEPVPPGHLAAACARTGRRPADVVARLRAYGFSDVPDPAALPATVDPDDVVPLSWNIDGKWSWRPCRLPVPPGHLVKAAVRTGRRPADLADRLRAFGFTDVPAAADLPATVDFDDVLLLSEDLDGREPWLWPEFPIPADHLTNAAAQTGLKPADLAARLRVFGFAL